MWILYIYHFILSQAFMGLQIIILLQPKDWGFANVNKYIQQLNAHWVIKF